MIYKHRGELQEEGRYIDSERARSNPRGVVKLPCRLEEPVSQKRTLNKLLKLIEHTLS